MTWRDEDDESTWNIYAKSTSRWEQIDLGIAPTAQGHMNISTWRLAVPSGWIYKVTEWDEEGHYTVQICFVPKVDQQGDECP
jgi:hypothetical protein